MSESDHIVDMVIDDLEERMELGILKYGEPLTISSHDMLQHAYEEALDLACYLKTRIEQERIKRKMPNLR